MRRIFEVISLGLLVMGLELAAGTPSLTISRLSETLANPLGPENAEGLVWRPLVGLGLIVAAGALATMVVAVRLRQGTVQEHVGCPECGARTKRVRRRVRHRVLGRLMGRSLSARLCGDCGWRGLSYKY